MMKQPRPTEAEVLDVALGNADPSRQSRVCDGVSQDLKLASEFSQWTAVADALRRQTDLERASIGLVAQRVMSRLDDVIGKQAIPYPEDAPSPGVRARMELAVGLIQDIAAHRPKSLAAACGAVVLVLVAVSGMWYVGSGNSAVVEQVAGVARVIDDTTGEAVSPIRTGDRLSLPIHLDFAEASAVTLRMPHGARLSTLQTPCDMYLSSSRLVRQNSGIVTYRIEHNGRGLAPFTVAAPQGRVVDIGTEFEVDAAKPNATVVRVDAGKVRVEPNHGTTVEANQGERAIVTDTRAVTETVPAADGKATGQSAEKKASTSPDEVRVVYRPQEKVMSPTDPLRVFSRPRTLTLAPDPPPSLKKRPPFTSERPVMGMLQTFVEGRVVEAAVACDQKLDGKTRIYLDANLNGDLTDDPTFSEGEEFKPGQLFAAGLLGHNDALWLRSPVRVDTSTLPPKVEGIPGQLEYINRVYLSGEVEVPLSQSAPPRPRSVYMLLDTNSDGSYVDNDGSLAIWAQADPATGVPALLNATTPTKPAAYMGYRWTLSRELSGEYTLTGGRVKAMDRANAAQPGKPWPARDVTTIDGRTIRLAAPAKGYLLVYVWSSWYSACQRDVPYDFNDLYPKFKDRGLAMVGISTDYRSEDLNEYVRSHSMEFPQIYNGPDLSEGIAAELGVERSPLAVLVDPGGVVVSVGKSADELWTFLDARLPK